MTTQPELGEWRKQAGVAQVDAATAPEWKELADAVIARLAMSGEGFTSEDVTAVVGQPVGPNGEAKPNAVGAMFVSASKRGVIERVGFVKAERDARHAGMISLWRGK